MDLSQFSIETAVYFLTTLWCAMLRFNDRIMAAQNVPFSPQTLKETLVSWRLATHFLAVDFLVHVFCL